MLQNEIEPKMARIKKEREQSMEYRKIKEEFVKLQNYIIAYDYYEQRKVLKAKNMDLTSFLSNQTELARKLEKNNSRIKKNKNELDDAKKTK
mmetsp:Transcript_2590/g.2219  ORF Transcript_2590/g.2219 Transcript_2590/m.2219 type:complete len:92 (-) Transcript_2590:156-431(-)